MGSEKWRSGRPAVSPIPRLAHSPVRGGAGAVAFPAIPTLHHSTTPVEAGRGEESATPWSAYFRPFDSAPFDRAPLDYAPDAALSHSGYVGRAGQAFCLTATSEAEELFEEFGKLAVLT